MKEQRSSKVILPQANKTKMIRVLRDRGFDVANSRKAEFSSYRTSFWLDYEDSTGAWHRATYSAAAGRPFFMVDRNCIDFSMDDVKKFEIFRVRAPRPAAVED